MCPESRWTAPCRRRSRRATSRPSSSWARRPTAWRPSSAPPRPPSAPAPTPSGSGTGTSWGILPRERGSCRPPSRPRDHDIHGGVGRSRRAARRLRPGRSPFRRRGGHRAHRGRRHPLPRLRRRHRGQRARVQPSGRARGCGSRARYGADPRLEPVPHRARRAAGRGAGRAVLRRSGVLLQLGRRGERGRVQVRPQVVREERNRRLHRQLPRTPLRHARRTDRPEYRKPFEPLVPGIRIVPREDWAAVDHAVSASRTAAVIVEPVQGEGGVRPIDPEWLGFLRELCDSRGVAVIFDEVQCGLGRTGTLFAYEPTGVVPDVLTLAKPLGGGLPMGAVLLRDAIAGALRPGDHATTFGGGPLVASVALEVVRTLADPAFLADVRRKAEWLGARLARLAAGAPRVREVRGRGLMWGLELAEPAAPIVAAAREQGLLVVTAGPQVVGLLPPLVITLEELERGVAILEEILA